MSAFGIKRSGYTISIATLISLVWLLLGPARPLSSTGVARAASDPVIAAAGDIACDPSNSSFNNGNGTSGSCRQKYTSDLLVNAGLAAVLPLGDNQYYCGGYQAFLQSYDLSWGRVKSITRPVVGNHEYLTAGGTDCNINNEGASGYYTYFGSSAGDPTKGYYSYDIGTWHLIALNSNCSDAGGCGSTSPQGKWLVADLAAHSNFCTLAYWHIPLFSSGGRASSNTQSIWQTLYNNNVDVVLNGHDHIYERFAPQTPSGTLDTVRGIREFIVGSGGANHTSLATITANSEVRNTDTYGILKLTLHPTGYDWQFVHEAGKTFTDSGTGNCHGIGSSGTPIPTATNTPTASATPLQTQTPSLTPTSTPNGSIFNFTPVADAYIDQTNSNTNYGSITTLQADNTPVDQFLLKFNVNITSGQQISSAKLRLYNVNPSNKGGDFYRVSNNNWQENTITWNNAPTADTTLLASLGAVQSSTWYEINLTSLITSPGTYSLRISTTSVDGADYSSKEGANPPQLIIETQTAPTSTATATPTASPTATNTYTPTAPPTSTSTPLPTSTFTPTATTSPSQTPTRTPTNTFTPTSTSTPIPASTPTASPTSTSTFTPTSTASFPPTFTPSLTQTSTASPAPISTFTPTSTSTATLTTSSTPLPTQTPTASQTATGTFTPTATATPTDTATSTPTASVTPSQTATPSPTQNFLLTETATGTPVFTDTPNPTDTPTATPGETASPTLLPVDTPTDTPTPTQTPVDLPTDTPTPTPSPTTTPTETPAASATTIPTSTPEPSPTPILTSTATATQMPTNTATSTPQPSPTAIATQTATVMPTSTPAPVTYIFTPSADSYVDQANPTTNNGSSTQIRVDGSPFVRSYIRFNIQGISGTVTRVTLRVYANSSSSRGYTVSSVSDNTWTESTIIYNNAPAIGSAAGSSIPFNGGAWTTVDITSLVPGNGVLNIALTTSSSTAISLASRESGANAPQLIVETVH